MKGGNTYRMRGKHFSSTLICLALITVFIWSFERRPPSTTLFSSPGHLDLPGSDVTFATQVPKDIMEPKNHPRQEDTHVYDEIEMESKKISSEGLEEDSALITLKNENESTSAFENDSREEAYSIKDKDPELSGDDRGIESEIDGSDDDDSQKNESDSTSSLDDNDKEAYPKNDKVSDFKDDERGIESEIDGFDDDSSQKNESDSTSSLGNNDKEAYPKNDKVSGFKDDERGTQSQTTSLDGSESTPSLSSKTEGSKRASKSSLDKKGNKDAYQMGNMSSVLSTKSKVCNYGKGRWVVDNRRPLYSGLKCKQWLSEMWACRLTERSDFSYEAYRWQPENCEMPEFDRSEFLRRMQDKTIAFIGDSLGRQQYQSLLCMVTGGEEDLEVQDVGSKYGFVLDPGAIRPNGWAFWFPKTNTTILFYWSACLCDLEPLNSTDSTSQIAMHLDRPPSFLKRNLPNFDVLILNTGHHWNRGKVNANRWVMYSDGKPVTNKRLAMVGNAKNFTIHSVARWLDNQLRFHTHVKAFFRTISPRHFFNGDWNTGGSCENTTPLAKGSAVLQDGSSDTVIASAVNGTKVRLLDITALSTLRDEGHISRYSIKSSQGIQDCLHWCLPGIPDTWNEIVSAQV